MQDVCLIKSDNDFRIINILVAILIQIINHTVLLNYLDDRFENGIQARWTERIFIVHVLNGILYLIWVLRISSNETIRIVCIRPSCKFGSKIRLCPIADMIGVAISIVFIQSRHLVRHIIWSRLYIILPIRCLWFDRYIFCVKCSHLTCTRRRCG